MEIVMKNLYLKSSQQNRTQVPDPAYYRDVAQKPKQGSTLQRKVFSKSQIIITRPQLHEAAWLFKKYGLPKPGWLRERFRINQRRRRTLNGALREAGLDRVLCDSPVATQGWSGLLHTLWHQVNEVKLCR